MDAEGTIENRVRVAVVDDEEAMRLLIKAILEGTRDFCCAGSFSNGTEALVNIPGLSPELVLMDIRMPHINGIECTARLKRAMPNVKIIMMTGAREADLIDKSLEAGADGYLTKPVTVDQCLAMLRFALKGRASDCSPLSGRDNEVMQYLVEGLLYKEIADKMGISYSAVHKHQHRIFLKLHAANRAEAIRCWHGLGLR